MLSSTTRYCHDMIWYEVHNCHKCLVSKSKNLNLQRRRRRHTGDSMDGLTDSAKSSYGYRLRKYKFVDKEVQSIKYKIWLRKLHITWGEIQKYFTRYKSTSMMKIYGVIHSAKSSSGLIQVEEIHIWVSWQSTIWKS